MHAPGLLALSLALVPLAAQDPAPAPKHLVQVWIRDAATIERLGALDLDLGGCTAVDATSRTVDVYATDAEIERLRAAGLDFDVAIRDVSRHWAAEAAKHGQAPLTLTPPIGQGAMGGHYTLAQITAILDSFTKDHPTIASAKVSLGKSLEGRDLWMLKISDHVNVDENEPEVYFDATHHAREPLSNGATLVFMDWLLTNYGKDPFATWLVDERELFFVPLVNPDGYEYNRQTNPNGGGMWRKNRRNNGGSYGVDLNRNYATAWNAPNGGNSTNPTSETYRGTAPFSEPETTVLEAFHQTRSFVQVFSTHTYTDVLLRPWGWQYGNPPNNADYVAVGQQAVASNRLQHGDAATLLYIAAGTTIDHHHTVRGALSWTAELGRSNEGGFWPSGPKIREIAERHQPMFRTIAATSGAYLNLGQVTVTEAPGGNNNGTVEPGEAGLVTVSLRNDGALAFASTVSGSLKSLSPGVTVPVSTADFGKPAKFSTASNGAAPFRFQVPSGYAEPFVRLQLEVTGDGRTVRDEIRIPYAAWRLAVDTEFERDHGFTRGSGDFATTGLFERAAPQATTAQPGSDHSPTGTLCWVTDGRGGSAGTYDVDAGWTDCISPRIDLAHLGLARIELWYWYAETASDDDLEIAISNDDGASWTPLLRRGTSTNAWTQLVAEIPVPLTHEMRLRMRAQDLVPSTVEACLDDLRITGMQPDASTTILSSGTLGTDLRIGLCGQPAGQMLLLASLGTADISIPGITGNLLLDPATLNSLPALGLDASGYAAHELPIPNDPRLRGTRVYFQSLQAAGATLRLGNRTLLDLN